MTDYITTLHFGGFAGGAPLGLETFHGFQQIIILQLSPHMSPYQISDLIISPDLWSASDSLSCGCGVNWTCLTDRSWGIAVSWQYYCNWNTPFTEAADVRDSRCSQLSSLLRSVAHSQKSHHWRSHLSWHSLNLYPVDDHRQRWEKDLSKIWEFSAVFQSSRFVTALSDKPHAEMRLLRRCVSIILVVLPSPNVNLSTSCFQLICSGTRSFTQTPPE